MSQNLSESQQSHVFFSFCNSPKNKTQMDNPEIQMKPSVVSDLHSDDADKQMSAIEACRKFSIDESNIKCILRMNLLPRIVELLRISDVPKVQMEAARYITSLAAGACIRLQFIQSIDLKSFARKRRMLQNHYRASRLRCTHCNCQDIRGRRTEGAVHLGSFKHHRRPHLLLPSHYLARILQPCSEILNRARTSDLVHRFASKCPKNHHLDVHELDFAALCIDDETTRHRLDFRKLRQIFVVAL